MYCANCGRTVSESAKFCSVCGTGLTTTEQVAEPNEAVAVNDKKVLIGYSTKINDPAFAKYAKSSNRWALIFSMIIALIAVIGFPVYGEVSGELEMPYSLYYGLGIGGMFIVIALMQVMSKKRDSTWDGVVVDKQVYQKRSWDKNTETYHTYTIYEYKVKRDDNGKVYSQRCENDDTVYNYYSIGDRLRHHKGMGYEKYDKSQDTFLFCATCASINDISDELCFRCNCPLLK